MTTPEPITVKLHQLQPGTQFNHKGRLYAIAVLGSDWPNVRCHPVVSGIVQSRVTIELPATDEVEI